MLRENNRNQTEKKTFLSGVLLLTVSTVLVKIVGLLYKIPMLSYLGSEGMGYFNSAYEIYALFCVIATAGLPVALSVLISASIAKGNSVEVRRIFRIALRIFLGIGITGTVLMAAFSGVFCNLIKSENARLCILSISPTVLTVCVSSALRGYFQGHQKMLQTAVSQLIEAVGKLAFGLLFAKLALDAGRATNEVAAAAGLGLTLGTFLSMLYLIVEKLRFRVPASAKKKSAIELRTASDKHILLSLSKLAIPVTVGASAVSLTKLIDMTMILRRLQGIGYTAVLANEAYGNYTTLALSVYGLLPTLVNSIALPLIPMLSAAIASGDRNRQEQLVASSYRLTALFAIPAALGVSAFAKPILILLFPGETEAVSAAAPLLSILGASVFLSCMITATNSVLHAYRSVNRPILSLLAGSAVKIVSAYFLIGNAQIGIIGAPISSLLCNATVVLLNLLFAARLCRVSSFAGIFFRPFLIAFASVGLAEAGYLFLSGRIGERSLLTLACIGFTVLLYLTLTVFFGGLRDEDLSAIPFGSAFLRMKSRLIHRKLPLKGSLK